MDALIYTAMSGAERALRGQQVHANNLANMDTAGFRANMELATASKLPGYGYDERRHVTVWGRAATAGDRLTFTAARAWGWDEAEVPFFEYAERSVPKPPDSVL